MHGFGRQPRCGQRCDRARTLSDVPSPVASTPGCQLPAIRVDHDDERPGRRDVGREAVADRQAGVGRDQVGQRPDADPRRDRTRSPSRGRRCVPPASSATQTAIPAPRPMRSRSCRLDNLRRTSERTSPQSRVRAAPRSGRPLRSRAGCQVSPTAPSETVDRSRRRPLIRSSLAQSLERGPGEPAACCSSCARSVVAPRPVSRYGRRRSSGSRASIRPRRSSRASAPYSVPGPRGEPEIVLDVGHDRVAVLRAVAQRHRMYSDGSANRPSSGHLRLIRRRSPCMSWVIYRGDDI